MNEKKIHHLPGRKIGPKGLLASQLENADEMKGVLVGILWNDDTCDVAWSCLPKSAFSWIVLNLLRTALRETTDESTIIEDGR